MTNPTATVSARAAIAAVRRAGLTDRLAGKIPGGDVRVLAQYPAETARMAQVLRDRFPAATVTVEDALTVRIRPAA